MIVDNSPSLFNLFHISNKIGKSQQMNNDVIYQHNVFVCYILISLYYSIKKNSVF